MEFEDPELEPYIAPVDARLAIQGRTEEFRAYFEKLAGVAPQKEKIPGTSLVQVAAEDESVVFTATDGAQALVVETSTVRIHRVGKVRLPAHKLKSILALVPEETLTLTVVDDRASIVSGRAVWNLAVPSNDRVVAVPDISEVELFSIPRRPLFKALNAVRRALPSQGSRKSLEQVNVAAGFLTASDGYRLLRRRVDGMPEKLNFSIPKDTVDALLRSLTSGGEENLLLGANNDLIVLKDRGETIVSRQLALDFPDLEAQLIVPTLSNKSTLIVDSIELRDLIKRVRVFSDPDYAAVSLRVSRDKSGEWELLVSARDRAGNSAAESMYAQWEGEQSEASITVNHKFLTDLLDAYNGRLASIKVGDSSRARSAPMLIRDDDKGFTGVVQQSIG